LGQKDFKVFGFSTLLACLNAMTKFDLLAQPPKNINYIKKLFCKLALTFLVPYLRVDFSIKFIYFEYWIHFQKYGVLRWWKLIQYGYLISHNLIIWLIIFMKILTVLKQRNIKIPKLNQKKFKLGFWNKYILQFFNVEVDIKLDYVSLGHQQCMQLVFESKFLRGIKILS